ncbi:hypothetical protein, partial [Ideonella azotifigens]|uniref:hypothetical protein n=1 Tax=Ideonella azotifigens TaxID=513160 RepID=UPI001B865CBF
AETQADDGDAGLAARGNVAVVADAAEVHAPGSRGSSWPPGWVVNARMLARRRFGVNADCCISSYAKRHKLGLK